VDYRQRNFGAPYQSAAVAMLDERSQNLAVSLPFWRRSSRQIEARDGNGCLSALPPVAEKKR
jgi:hypothetical protein